MIGRDGGLGMYNINRRHSHLVLSFRLSSSLGLFPKRHIVKSLLKNHRSREQLQHIAYRGVGDISAVCPIHARAIESRYVQYF